jgi:hypothetical protein
MQVAIRDTVQVAEAAAANAARECNTLRSAVLAVTQVRELD